METGPRGSDRDVRLARVIARDIAEMAERCAATGCGRIPDDAARRLADHLAQLLQSPPLRRDIIETVWPPLAEAIVRGQSELARRARKEREHPGLRR
jgi:hypothetical protein